MAKRKKFTSRNIRKGSPSPKSPRKNGFLQKISLGIALGLTAYGSFFVRLADLFSKEGI